MIFPVTAAESVSSVSLARGERAEIAALRTRISTLWLGNFSRIVEAMREADEAAEVRGAAMNSKVPGGYWEESVAASWEEVE